MTIILKPQHSFVLICLYVKHVLVIEDIHMFFKLTELKRLFYFSSVLMPDLLCRKQAVESINKHKYLLDIELWVRLLTLQTSVMTLNIHICPKDVAYKKQ